MLPSQFDRTVEFNRMRHTEMLAEANKVRLLRQPQDTPPAIKVPRLVLWWRGIERFYLRIIAWSKASKRFA
jgi:hypothetical protein